MIDIPASFNDLDRIISIQIAVMGFAAATFGIVLRIRNRIDRLTELVEKMVEKEKG